MKKEKLYIRMAKLVCSLILLTVVVYSVSNNSRYFKRLNINNLESASISGLRLGEQVNGNSRSLSFKLTDPKQYNILSKVINELNGGQILKIKEDNLEFFHPGGSGAMIELCFKNGTVIRVKSSTTFIREVEDGYIVYKSKIIDYQVTLYANYLGEGIRIAAPETKKMIGEDLGKVIDLMQ